MWWEAIPAFLPVQVSPVWVQAVHQGQLFGRQLCCSAFGICLFFYALDAKFCNVLGSHGLVTCSWVHAWLLSSIHVGSLCPMCIWRRWQVQCTVLFLHLICEDLDLWYYICIISSWWSSDSSIDSSQIGSKGLRLSWLRLFLPCRSTGCISMFESCIFSSPSCPYARSLSCLMRAYCADPILML